MVKKYENGFNFLRSLALFFVSLNLYITAFGQADAGEDKVICLGQSVDIGVCNDLSCDYFIWEDQPVGSNNPNNWQDEMKTTVSPTETTTYAFTIGDCDDLCIPCTDIVNVIVIKDVVLEIETNTDGYEVTECMIGRTLTFTATSQYNDPPSNVNDLDVIYVFSVNDGITNYEVEVLPVSNDSKVALFDFEIPSLLPGGAAFAGYNISCSVKINDVSCGSNSIFFVAYDPRLEYIGSNYLGINYPGKAVVGKPLIYFANASSDCFDWYWNIGTQDVWHVEFPWGPPGREGAMRIPNSDYPECEDYSLFGNYDGVVSYSFVDGEGTSYDLNSGIGNSLKVYYEGIDFGNGTQDQNGQNVPNYFCYWEAEFLPNSNNIIYQENTVFGEYDYITYEIGIGGSSGWTGQIYNNDLTYDFCGMMTNICLPYFNFPQNYPCGNNPGLPSYTRPNLDGKKGVELFMTTYTHEMKHADDHQYYVDNDPQIDPDGDHLPNFLDPDDDCVNGGGPIYELMSGCANPVDFWKGDWEYIAREVEGNYTISNQNNDWSSFGKNW